MPRGNVKRITLAGALRTFGKTPATPVVPSSLGGFLIPANGEPEFVAPFVEQTVRFSRYQSVGAEEEAEEGEEGGDWKGGMLNKALKKLVERPNIETSGKKIITFLSRFFVSWSSIDFFRCKI